MRRLLQFKAGLLFAFVLLTSVAFAQDKKPASPHDSTTAVVAGSTIKIKYGSPYVKGRKVLGGELVPFDKVWRAGADSATTVTTSKAIKVEGKTLAAGRYAFFVIPDKNGNWTIIFDKNPKQWGAYTYKESNDALRVTVKGKTIPKEESLSYTITKTGFALKWDTFEVPVSIK